MSKPTLTPIKPLVLMTRFTPEGHPVGTPDPQIPWHGHQECLRNSVNHDLKLLHSLKPVLEALDTAVGLDDSNVSPNATICKLAEALGLYREIRS